MVVRRVRMGVGGSAAGAPIAVAAPDFRIVGATSVAVGTVCICLVISGKDDDGGVGGGGAARRSSGGGGAASSNGGEQCLLDSA